MASTVCSRWIDRDDMTVRRNLWFIAFIAVLAGCAAPRTFVPERGRPGFANLSGMEMSPGDEIEVTLLDGYTLSGVFVAIAGEDLVFVPSAPRGADAQEQIVVSLSDIEKVVASKASAREFIVTVLFLVPVSFIVYWLSTQHIGLD